MKKVWFLVLSITALLFLAACSTGEAGSKPVEKYKMVFFEDKDFGESGFSKCQKAGFKQCIMVAAKQSYAQLDSTDGSCTGKYQSGVDAFSGTTIMIFGDCDTNLGDDNTKSLIYEDCGTQSGTDYAEPWQGDIRIQIMPAFALCARN